MSTCKSYVQNAVTILVGNWWKCKRGILISPIEFRKFGKPLKPDLLSCSITCWECVNMYKRGPNNSVEKFGQMSLNNNHRRKRAFLLISCLFYPFYTISWFLLATQNRNPVFTTACSAGQKGRGQQAAIESEEFLMSFYVF